LIVWVKKKYQVAKDKNQKVFHFIFQVLFIDVREYIDCLPGPPALFWLRSYVARHCIAVVPQSGAKQFFIVLFTTLLYIQTVKLREHLKI
jgi:hypothetical protein